jgi:Transposase, Mutator family
VSRIDWAVVRIRDLWTFSGKPSSPATPCRATQRWTATRPAAVLERALEAELTAHLGYDRRGERPAGAGNYRNGTIAKTVQTGVGPVPLAVPRDRAGTFEPLLVPKRAGRVAGGLDDMVISLYACVILSFGVSRGCDLRRPVVESVADGALAV